MIPGTVSKFNPTSFAVALALGVAAVTLTSFPAMAEKQAAAPKIKLSKSFLPLAMDMSKAIDTAKARPDVVAASQKVKDATAAYNQARGAQRQTAMAAREAALAELGNALSAEKAKLESLFASAATPDDKYQAGALAVNLGGLAQTPLLQRRGILSMLESGKASPAEAPRLNYYAGSLSFDARDFAQARTSLEAAIAAGYTENDVAILLAEAYLSDNQVPAGLIKLQQAIDGRTASGTQAPAAWYRRGLGAAYNARILDQAMSFSRGYVKAYPTTENWATAITIVREVGKFPTQETLDLMRLMGRTGAFSEERDYIEYIQAADPRRFPGEALKAIEAGLASGKLRANDAFVIDSRTMARDRVGADKASLPAFERDARLASATGATVSGAADAFLSYGEPAKAEELYTIALGKAGIDGDRVLTRLGIAQFDQGKYAQAQQTFARVNGVRKAMADLWSLLASQKAMPVAPATPTPAS